MRCIVAAIVALGWGGLAMAQAETVTPLPADRFFAQEEAAVFASPPDIAHCVAGTLNERERISVTDTVNAIRAAHRLPPVTYDRADEDQVMAAALMMAANGALNHRPPANWLCYSAAGAAGAGSSNLSGGVVSPYLGFQTSREHVIGWLTDVHNAVGGTGHRRWMLSPFVTQISFGRVGSEAPNGERRSAAALKTFNFTSEAPRSDPLPDFVAYPFGAYPAEFYEAGALLSFAPIVDKVDRWNNLKVDLTQAHVVVSTAAGVIPVRIERRSNEGFGYTSVIEFSAGGLAVGMRYHVEIDGIAYNGAPRHYAYDFTLTGRAAP